MTTARRGRRSRLALLPCLAVLGCASSPQTDPGADPAVDRAEPDSAAIRAVADSAAHAREDSVARNPVIEFTHDGRERRALVHLPPGWEQAERLALILAFHGGGGAAAGFREYVRLDATADREGFIVAYPDGTGPVPGRLLTWNAGSCCGYASDHDVDDVGFVLELLEDLGDRYPIDARRVYATGFSNGAMFTYRLASEAPALISAIAPVAGAGSASPPSSGLPVPIIHFHSVDDPRALYSGGLGPPFPLTDRRVEHVAVETVIGTWAEHDRCLSSPEVRVRIQPIEDPSDASQGATRVAYRACARGSEVILWKLTGAGHVWPGAGTLRIQRLLGPPTGIVDANIEMWKFFERHVR